MVAWTAFASDAQWLTWAGTAHCINLRFAPRNLPAIFMVANQSTLVNLSTEAKNLLAGAGATVKQVDARLDGI